jgi:pimeloyl-ACP methyl ester carboxylesterase
VSTALGNGRFATGRFAASAVNSSGVRIATRDYGGDGPALVLMHGAGMEQGSLAPLAVELQRTFRVVTFDFRGHGGSDRAPWTFASAVADVGAVAEAYGLGVPAVGGHSLGGMVAAGYGAQHPTCPGVVNIDGHGRGRVEQYTGYEPREVRELWAQQDRRIERLTTGSVAVALRLLLLALRKPATAPETPRQVMREVDGLDLFALYRRLDCSLLLFNATAPETRRVMKLLAGKSMPMTGAYRSGIGRDLDALVAEKARVEAVTVDATHMLIKTHPELVARHIEKFLSP